MVQEELDAILSQLRTSLAQLLDKKLVAVYLYGSRARGDARPDSDIDILIILKGNFDYFGMVELTGPIVAGLSLEHNTVISLTFTTKEDFEHRQNPFLMNVRQEGIAV